MTATIIPFSAHVKPAPRRREPQRFTVAVQAALSMLAGVREDLGPYKAPRIKRAAFLVDLIVETLETSRGLYADEARLGAREAMLAGLGPGVTKDDLDGARRALELMLECLPEGPK